MIPFGSDKKWSGVQFSDGSCYVMGTAQFVLGDDYERVGSQVERLAADTRLLLIARVQGCLSPACKVSMSWEAFKVPLSR